MKRLLLLLSIIIGFQAAIADSFRAGEGTFLLNDQPYIVKAAELHYPRIPREYWEHRIEMVKALGMNTICMYVFWNIHEPKEDEFDFTGQNDIDWQTVKGDGLPHLIVIDLGDEQPLTGIQYLPRAEQGAPHAIKGYKIYVY